MRTAGLVTSFEALSIINRYLNINYKLAYKRTTIIIIFIIKLTNLGYSLRIFCNAPSVLSPLFRYRKTYSRNAVFSEVAINNYLS